MTVDHFGSGGRRSDSRLGRRGKKLQESRNLANSRFLKFSDFRCISLYENLREKKRKFAENLIFLEISEITGKIKGGTFEIGKYRQISKKEMQRKSGNFRNRDFARFLEFFSQKISTWVNKVNRISVSV